MLSQLPATAPDILDALPFNVDALSDLGHYTVEGEPARADAANKPISRWEQLGIVHHIGDYVLRIALGEVFRSLDVGLTLCGACGDVLDSILILLDLCIQLAVKEHLQDVRWLIVCAYLWTTWQRSIMIYLWVNMSRQLSGFNYEDKSDLHCKMLSDISTVFKSRNQKSLEELRRIPYLCGWSFRSLRNDPANVAMDLRHFHESYFAHFGERQANCNHGPSQCDGSSSLDCRRFRDSRAENQSVHDILCKGSCRRLFWSRDSFTSISGPRAVDIVATSAETIRYCKVTKNTLTVSHVWSHGQGGRPDNVGSEGTGFNLCLHRRYTELARSLGCDSYWMDTPCIPSEKELRWECISQITAIFTTSGKTIICDRDIMTIDISQPTLAAYESVLATLLVCDWSIRAWTLLEAQRGRHGLFVLCRYNKYINLHELLRLVHKDGRMDLTNLFASRDYLFPPKEFEYFEIFGEPMNLENEQEIAEGFVNIGTAAALLSHRHATRDGDDLLIWSFLIGDIEDESPIAMWKRHIGKSIHTGSLISSAQRIQGHPGLGWAPFTPTGLPRTIEQSTEAKVYPAHNGDETVNGLITEEGLRAKWLTHYFPAGLAAFETVQGRFPPEPFADIAEQYLRGYEQGALLQPAPCKGPRNIPISYRASYGWLVVVCGLRNEDVWEWKGVYEWDASIALPPFVYREILLI